MEASTGIRLVAADHPSLSDDVEAFLDRLQVEHRRSGSSVWSGPRPFRALPESLRARGGFRVAAIECGCIVGLARVDGGGELFLAVSAEHRNRGIGTVLGRATAARARELHYRRLILRTSGWGPAARRIGERLGGVVLDLGRGRIELLLEPVDGERSA